MSEHETVPGRTRSTGVNKSLSRAWTAPVRAMNRFLGTTDGQSPDVHDGSTASAVVDCAARGVRQ
jgi:magnesium transporter